jgi:hypothetical protein
MKSFLLYQGLAFSNLLGLKQYQTDVANQDRVMIRLLLNSVLYTKLGNCSQNNYNYIPHDGLFSILFLTKLSLSWANAQRPTS